MSPTPPACPRTRPSCCSLCTRCSSDTRTTPKDESERSTPTRKRSYAPASRPPTHTPPPAGSDRSRHYALWLMFVSQHFRDLSNEQGRALLANGALSFCLRNDRDDLEHAREPLGLSDTDIAQIQALPKQHGVYSTVYMVSARGRG